MSLSPVASKMFPGAVVQYIEPLTGGVSADVQKLILELPNGETKRVVVRAHHASHTGHAAELEFSLVQALHRTC